MDLTSTGDYQQRVSRIREAMTIADIDMLLIYGWKRGQIRYVSGYYPNYQANVAMIIFPRESDPVMLIRFPFDLERAKRESWIREIKASGSVFNMAEDSASIIREKNGESGCIGMVTGDDTMDEMPYSLYESIIKKFPKSKFVDAKEILVNTRKIKSPWEFKKLRESAKVADAGVRAAKEIIRPGVSEFDPVIEAEYIMRKQGAGNHLIVIASKGVSELIGPPEHKILEEGDNVIFELGVEIDGYWSQVAQVFYVGGPSPEQRKIYLTTYEAYLAGISAAYVGNTCSNIAKASMTILEDAGYGDYIQQDFGHSIGLDLPEIPRIEFEDHTIVQPGMVLVIHPAVRVPGLGGAFIGGTVLINDDGPEPIHNISEYP